MLERRALLAGLAMLGAGSTVGAQGQAPAWAGQAPILVPPDATTIELWPAQALARSGIALVETVVERSAQADLPDRAVHGITRPRLVAFRSASPNGTAVLIIPGGGYRRVVIDREGFELARWLTTRGYTALVLFHRLPADGWAEGPDAPLADAQRAMRLIRHNSALLRIAPDRVAALGFSAGGHVCADLAARFAMSVRAPIDAIDRLSARPDVAAPIYPVIAMDPAIAHQGSRQHLLGIAPTPAMDQRHSPDRNVPADAPPHFLLHAEDDASVVVEHSLRLRAALKARAIPVRTHLFETGGHGFGLSRAAGHAVAGWPGLLDAWLTMRFTGA